MEKPTKNLIIKIIAVDLLLLLKHVVLLGIDRVNQIIHNIVGLNEFSHINILFLLQLDIFKSRIL
jgi:hypothetical protein